MAEAAAAADPGDGRAALFSTPDEHRAFQVAMAAAGGTQPGGALAVPRFFFGHRPTGSDPMRHRLRILAREVHQQIVKKKKKGGREKQERKGKMRKKRGKNEEKKKTEKDRCRR